MTTTTRRDELLSTIALDTTLHQVIDDLGGLERLVPEAPWEVEALALFRHQLPGLLELRGRGQAHTEQVRRLIGLIALEKDQVEAWIDIANALTILTNASNLALLVLPARSEDDAWAREQFGRNLLRHARRHGDGEDLALATRAVGDLPRRPAHISMPAGADAIREMIETIARRVGALQQRAGDTDEPDAHRAHTLEQAESLKAYFEAAPDLPSLLDGARSVLALVDEVSATARSGVMATDVIEGGLILA